MGKDAVYFGRRDLQDIYSRVKTYQVQAAKERKAFDPQQAFVDELEKVTGGKVVAVQMKNTTDVEVRIHTEGGSERYVTLLDAPHSPETRDAGKSLAHVVQRRWNTPEYKMLIPQQVAARAAHTGQILDRRM